MSKRPLDQGEGELQTAKQPRVEAANGVKLEADQEVQDQQQPARRDVQYPVLRYKDGEPLSGLQSLYESASTEDKLVEVVIPAEHVNNNNRRVKTRQIWGDKVYTGDSDIVAVLMHQGYYAHYLAHPPSQVFEFHALIRLVPSPDVYVYKNRFVKSRAWNSKIEGCAYQVESCWMVTRAGATIDLQPNEVTYPIATVHTNTNTQHHTRSSGRKVGQEVTMLFNLCNEPWLKYTLPAIADRGLKASQWTSARLLDEVLLLETSTARYQVARTGTANDDTAAGSGRVHDVYSLSKCKVVLPMGAMRRSGLPLPAGQVEVLEEGLGWEELQWGCRVLQVRGRELPVKRMHFAALCKAKADA